MKCFLKFVGWVVGLTIALAVAMLFLAIFPIAIERFWMMFFEKDTGAFLLTTMFSYCAIPATFVALLWRKEICGE